jgi:hypothetical protein
MTEAEWVGGEEVSILSLAATLLGRRWSIVRWMFIGAAVAALSVFSRQRMYVATVAFIPQGTDVSRSGLASLAGQFGVSLPAGNQSLTPDFYALLLKSRVMQGRIARDTFVVSEMSDRRVTFLDLFQVKQGPPAVREEQGMRILPGLVTTSILKTSGVVQSSVKTPWPSVSLAIATALVNGVNDFNLLTRQGQASAERKFIEGRLAVAEDELHVAEDRMERFLRSNRDIGTSPELRFEQDRLQREVLLRQQVYTSLTQALEDARAREVRDTPVITMFEPPSVKAVPEPRGRLGATLLGFVLGGLVGAVVAIVSGLLAHLRRVGNAHTDVFLAALDELKGEMLVPVRWIGERFPRRLRSRKSP